MQYTLEQENINIFSKEEAELALENISIALEDIQDLVKYKFTVESVDNIDKNSKVFLKQTLEGFYKKYEFTTPSNIATEAFNDNTKSVALEGFKDILVRIWEAIKNTFKAVWDYILKLVDGTEHKNNKTVEKLEKAEKRVDEVKKKVDKNPNIVKPDPTKTDPDYINDSAILDGFSSYSGSIDKVKFTEIFKTLLILVEDLNDIDIAISEDNFYIAKFIEALYKSVVNGISTEDSLEYTKTKLKFKTTECISSKFQAGHEAVPNIVIDKTSFNNGADFKSCRIAKGLSHNGVVYFIKPLEPVSFYRITIYNKQVDTTCKMKYLNVDELSSLLSDKTLLTATATLLKADFRKRVDSIKKSQDIQTSVINNFLHELTEDSYNGTSIINVKESFKLIIELYKQLFTLVSDNCKVMEGLSNSASFYARVIDFMVTHLEDLVKEKK